MQETRLFVASQMQEDRSVVELLTANYTFLNERLAKHYGIPNVYGSHFRRVDFTDGMRGGLLGQASILTVTSYPNRTSVSDARQVAARQHARRAAAAAAARRAGAERSGRRRDSRGRCANGWRCTARTPPARRVIGGWIRSGSRSRISTRSASGARSATARRSTRRRRCRTEPIRRRRRACATLLVSHKEDFVRTFTEKLLAYALGRGLDYHDMPAVRKIARDAAAADYRWSSIILGIVKSPPFSMGSRGEPAISPALGGARRQMNEEAANDRHQEGDSAPHGLARHRRDAGAAAARQHGAGALGACEDRRPSRSTASASMYVPNGMIMKNYLPAAEGAGFELTPTLERAGAVPRSGAGAERPGTACRRRDGPAAPTRKPARAS